MKEFIKQIAEEAGALALEYWRTSSLDEESKDSAGKDIVTVADKRIEALLRERILNRFPGHSILGEEEGFSGGGDSCWIIDPIDGTASFAHGQRNFSISIAYEECGDLLAAAVYAPAHGEFFYAEKGKGAELNGVPIHVSGRKKMNELILATGFACLRAGVTPNNLENFCRVAPLVRGMRRLGSAALDLAYVACGQFDGFWEMLLNSYDVAAGILLIREAGGRVSDFDGSQKGVPGELLATNGLIHENLMELLD